jgi:hypothetical protein
MRKKTPLLEKTPFAISPKPMQGAHTPHAGLCAFSRVLRSLRIPTFCREHLHIKKRDRGFPVEQSLETLILLHLAGGTHMSDVNTLRKNESIEKMLGYTPPTQRCIADFLEAFHDQDLLRQARERADRKKLLSMLPDPSPALLGLEAVMRDTLKALSAHLFADETVATIDLGYSD